MSRSAFFTPAWRCAPSVFAKCARPAAVRPPLGFFSRGFMRAWPSSMSTFSMSTFSTSTFSMSSSLSCVTSSCATSSCATTSSSDASPRSCCRRGSDTFVPHAERGRARSPSTPSSASCASSSDSCASRAPSWPCVDRAAPFTPGRPRCGRVTLLGATHRGVGHSPSATYREWSSSSSSSSSASCSRWSLQIALSRTPRIARMWSPSSRFSERSSDAR